MKILALTLSATLLAQAAVAAPLAAPPAPVAPPAPIVPIAPLPGAPGSCDGYIAIVFDGARYQIIGSGDCSKQTDQYSYFVPLFIPWTVQYPPVNGWTPLTALMTGALVTIVPQVANGAATVARQNMRIGVGQLKSIDPTCRPAPPQPPINPTIDVSAAVTNPVTSISMGGVDTDIALVPMTINGAVAETFNQINSVSNQIALNAFIIGTPNPAAPVWGSAFALVRFDQFFSCTFATGQGVGAWPSAGDGNDPIA